MSKLMTALGVDRLPATEQLQLAHEILDNLAAEPELPPLSEAQRRELERRLVLLDANPATVSAWEDVQGRILARLSQ